jgi:putative transposase
VNFSYAYPEFFTCTCLEWRPVIASERHKDMIIESLEFLSRERRVTIFAFVLMHNHFHLIWQLLGGHKRSSVQRDLLKYTGQSILRDLKDMNVPMLNELRVDTSDRKYQVWERNALSISLSNEYFLTQKLNYIHNNPVRAGLCKHPEQYRYSSASYYISNERTWTFLQHYKG